MRRIGLIAGIVALVAALAFLNRSIYRNAPLDQVPPAQKAGTQAPSAAQRQPPPAEEAFGDPVKAKFRFTVGWKYDSANQANPEALDQALDAARQFARNDPRTVAMEIVDLDVPMSQRSPAARAVHALGFTMNGKPMPNLKNNPGEGTTNSEYIIHLLPYMTHL